MSKEEFLKIQTCVLNVNIHCDGCKHKVKKILQKVEGVYTIKIDSEQGKVTVSGNVDPIKLIKKLEKSGKHAAIWGSKPSNNNHYQLNNQFKNMQIEKEKGGNNKNQKGGGAGAGGAQTNNAQNFQQQLQKMQGFPDMKLPNLKDMKIPFKNPNQNQNNQKSVKFNLPDNEDDMSDDDYDDDDDFDDDDDYEDDMHHQHHPPLNKMNPIMKNGPNMMMMNGLNPQPMNPQANKNSENCGPVNGANGKKGGGGNVPIQMNGKGGGANDGKNGNGGKKGGGPNGFTNGGNQNQGGGSVKNGGKNGGGDAKNGNPGGAGGNNNNGNNGGGPYGGNVNGNGAKKGGAQPMNTLPFGFQNMGQMGSHMSNIPIGQMGQFGNMPRGVQLGNMPAVQGLPASAMNGGGGGGGGGYFPSAGPGGMNGDPAYQHQMAAAMMNQQRAMGNERFQPMMYARPPPAVNYMPPYPYPHPYQHSPHPPQGGDGYTHMFSDENTSSCNVM